jgi:hypothetical protein
MFAKALSRLTPRVVNEKWPLKYLMLSRKCFASGSELVQSLISSGGVSFFYKLDLAIPTTEARRFVLEPLGATVFTVSLRFQNIFALWDVAIHKVERIRN